MMHMPSLLFVKVTEKHSDRWKHCLQGNYQLSKSTITNLVIVSGFYSAMEKGKNMHLIFNI